MSYRIVTDMAAVFGSKVRRGFDASICRGTALAVGGIILAARLQTAADREYMARAAALVDVMAGAGKLIGMGITSYIIGRHSCTGVFVFCSILLLIFAVNGGFRSGRFTDLKYGCSPGD